MTQEEIIRMAREAGVIGGFDDIHQSIERFAALVAAHERNRLAWTQEHWTQYEHAIAAAEREACAEEAESAASDDNKYDIAAAIRARGEK